jgi:Rhs element Vgr protein
MPSPSHSSGSLATFTVKVNGSSVPDTFSIFSVHVEKNVNRISSARITVLDGNPSVQDFSASSSSVFVPGAKVTIEAGHDSHNLGIFTGIITGQLLRVDASIGSALEVECRDEAVKMIVGRKCATFHNQKDSDIISSVIASYGFTANVAATATVWPEQVQYYVSDWDFIVARAEANGMIVTTSGGKVTVTKPDANTASAATIGYGDGLFEFNAVMNAITQLGSATASAWDYKQQRVANSVAQSSYAGPGNISSKKLSEVVGLSSYGLQTSGALQNDELTTWTNAQLTKSEYAKIRGTAKFRGTTLVNVANYITLQGFGDRFNGDHFVSGMRHELSDGNWITEVNIGMSPSWSAETPDVMAPPASGLLPGARGLMNGVVKKINADPDSQYRILVDVPLFGQNGAGIWARLSNFYSTNGAGAFFLPEAGDEVVIGFLNEDPRYPVILGSMYSSKIKPVAEPDEKNSLKAIVSKSGISMQFNDADKTFTITTPSKNRIVFSDKDKKITIADQNANNIVMSGDGITMSSPKNITISSDQLLTLKGAQGVAVQSSGGDVQTSAMNIKETAQSQYSAEGNLTAKLQGGTETIIKGAMVMIN